MTVFATERIDTSLRRAAAVRRWKCNSVINGEAITSRVCCSAIFCAYDLKSKLTPRETLENRFQLQDPAPQLEPADRPDDGVGCKLAQRPAIIRSPPLFVSYSRLCK